MPAPVYYKVTRKDGTLGVSVKELTKTTAWKDILQKAVVGTIYVDVHADENLNIVYYSQTHEYSDKLQFKKILSLYREYTAVRYGISEIDGNVVLHLNLIMPTYNKAKLHK